MILLAIHEYPSISSHRQVRRDQRVHDVHSAAADLSEEPMAGLEADGSSLWPAMSFQGLYIYNDGLWWFMVDNINDDS